MDKIQDAVTETVNPDNVTLEELHRYQRQFLVHSFLYYKCDESIISDHEYDACCKRLVEAMKSDIAPQSEFYELCKELDSSGSGYYIQNYPPQIITTALRRLYHHKKPNEGFDQFIGRWGYSLV